VCAITSACPPFRLPDTHFALLCAAALAAASPFTSARAQDALPLPEIVVGGAGGALTSPNTDAARRAIEQTPGAVEVVPDTAFKDTPAQTIKDIVDFTPGVWAQPKWGDDNRLSIRGSGLSRNFHLRSTQLLMDGIPINTSDGYGDFHEIDPTAYRYVEVYKGANALRYGANALGGAINFVTPTGRDANVFESRLDGGSFGYLREQMSSGKAYGPFDYFITGMNSTNDGYRDHSGGHAQRVSGNFGYRFTPDVETRFYLNFNRVRQRIPGEVDKNSALTSPQAAWTTNVANDWQRNIDTARLANKTTLRFGDTTVDVGLYGIDRHLMHPIFEWLDYRYRDYGGFGRLVREAPIAGHRNRFVFGVNVLNGTIDADQYVNAGGNKGAKTKSLTQKPENYTAYVENSFYVVPQVALVAGTQYLHAVRDQAVNYTVEGDLAGRATYDIWSPKIGVLWEFATGAQAFANVSRSGEAPSFGEGQGSTVPWYDIEAQTATTYEIGTRGRRPDFTWDVALYRSDIRNELQCFTNSFGNCNVTNADRTVHQGIELGFGVAVLKNTFTASDKLWLNTAYTYSDFRYDNDATFGNNRLPGAPPHYLRAELLYKHPSGISFGPNVEWAPQDYFVDSANTLTTASYVLWGFRAIYDDDKNVSAYIEARNLADTTYIAATSVIDRASDSSRLFNPGNGRSIFAGLRFKL
jgi:iron complex outermembrane receptor protein